MRERPRGFRIGSESWTEHSSPAREPGQHRELTKRLWNAVSTKVAVGEEIARCPRPRVAHTGLEIKPLGQAIAPVELRQRAVNKEGFGSQWRLASNLAYVVEQRGRQGLP